MIVAAESEIATVGKVNVESSSVDDDQGGNASKSGEQPSDVASATDTATSANKKANTALIITLLAIGLAIIGIGAYGYRGNVKNGGIASSTINRAGIQTGGSRGQGTIEARPSDEFDDAADTMYATAADHTSGTRSSVQTSLMINPMYDTADVGVGGEDGEVTRANVLYEPRSLMTTSAAATSTLSTPANDGRKTPAASGAVDTPGAVYLVPSELAATRSGGDGGNDGTSGGADSWTINSTATSVKLVPNVLYAGGGAAPAASDAHAYADIHSGDVPPSSSMSGYVNISIEVMSAALSELPTMTRSEAEKKLAEENVDGGFMLRQKSDSTTKVIVSCVTKGVYEHYIMELVEDADKKGAKWFYKSQPLPFLSMVEAATELLKDKLVHSQPQLLRVDGEVGGVYA